MGNSSVRLFRYENFRKICIVSAYNMLATNNSWYDFIDRYFCLEYWRKSVCDSFKRILHIIQSLFSSNQIDKFFNRFETLIHNDCISASLVCQLSASQVKSIKIIVIVFSPIKIKCHMLKTQSLSGKLERVYDKCTRLLFSYIYILRFGNCCVKFIYSLGQLSAFDECIQDDCL